MSHTVSARAAGGMSDGPIPRGYPVPSSFSWCAYAICGTRARSGVHGIVERKRHVWVTWLSMSRRSSGERLPVHGDPAREARLVHGDRALGKGERDRVILRKLEAESPAFGRFLHEIQAARLRGGEPPRFRQDRLEQFLEVPLRGKRDADPVQGGDPFLGLTEALLEKSKGLRAHRTASCLPRRASFGSGTTRSGGNVTRNRLPRSRPSLSATIVPPCASTMARAIARPIPRPPKRRFAEVSSCRKRSKTTGRNSASMPCPSSSTAISRPPPGAWCPITRTVPPEGVNLTPFARRFQSTCLRRAASPSTPGNAGSSVQQIVTPLRRAPGLTASSAAARISGIATGPRRSSRPKLSIRERSIRSASIRLSVSA